MVTPEERKILNYDAWAMATSDHDALVAYMNENVHTVPFVAELHDFFHRHGHLSEKQCDVLRRIMGQKPKLLSLSRIGRALSKGQLDQVSIAKLRFDPYLFTHGTMDNVRRGHVLIGDFDYRTGEFHPNAQCTDSDIKTLIEINSDVKQAATSHGRKTGKCCCCGRKLTNPESVKLGIGPICANRFF